MSPPTSHAGPGRNTTEYAASSDQACGQRDHIRGCLRGRVGARTHRSGEQDDWIELDETSRCPALRAQRCPLWSKRAILWDHVSSAARIACGLEERGRFVERPRAERAVSVRSAAAPRIGVFLVRAWPGSRSRCIDANGEQPPGGECATRLDRKGARPNRDSSARWRTRTKDANE